MTPTPEVLAPLTPAARALVETAAVHVANMDRAWCREPRPEIPDGRQAVPVHETRWGALESVTWNPLWDIASRLPICSQPIAFEHDEINFAWNRVGATLSGEFPDHTWLILNYCAAIPNPHALSVVSGMLGGPRAPRGVVQVSAAWKTYWAWQLRQLGHDVVAFDHRDPADLPPHRFHEVRQIGGCVSAGYPDRGLLIVWPEPNDPEPFNALHCYRGHTVIYIGDEVDDIHADARFHQLLAEKWRLQICLPLLNFIGIRGRVNIYGRPHEWDES